MARLSNWKGQPLAERVIANFQKGTIFHVGLLTLYLFLVVSIQLFILNDGQVSMPFVLSQILALTVLIAVCPFLRREISCFKINIRDEIDRKEGIIWGASFFVLSFVILCCWYGAYYPGAFSAESLEQYRQVLSGEYHNRTPILQTWITFALPLKLTGKAGSVVLFQIVEYSAVIAYMLYVILRYGTKRIAALSFVYIMLNPVTGNMAVCPWSDTTFAMFAVLLMTLGFQVHITGGKWLDSKAHGLLLTLVMVLTTFISFRGILFTVPFLIAMLLHIDRKKKIRLLLLFILGVDMIRSCFYLVNPDTAGIWNYETEQVKFPVTAEELRMTDIVYGINGDVDWGLYPDTAENTLGLTLKENGVRDVLQVYTEFSRSSILKYIFWCTGVVNLAVVIAVLCKCKLRKRKDWNKITLALPLLCYNFGTMLLMTWSDFRFFYINFPVFPVILMILFGKKTQESAEESEEAAVSLTGREKNKKLDYQYVMAAFYACILFAMNCIMVFNMNFWSDEGYSIMLSRMSLSDMLNATAGDVHPPLYYILLQIICRLTGFSWISYRFLSVIPYGILLVFALTVIWKKFGKEPAIIWITFASLLNTVVEFNVQVRMYSWGAFFVAMSFYCLYEILENNRKKDYAAFAVMSLGAAYTHYYCLISVAFFYIVLLAMAIVKRKEYFRKVMLTCIVTVLAYLPWFFVLLTTFNRTQEGYWMTEIPSLKECLLFLFSGKYQVVFLAAFLVIIVIFMAYETGVLKFKASFKGNFPLSITVSDFHVNKRTLWLAAGALSVFGTVLTGIMVSKAFRPMFTVRYVYPVSAVAWLMLGICLSKYKKKTVLAAVIVLLVLKGGFPNYITNYNERKYEESRLKAVLDATAGEISEDDAILTDVDLFRWVNVATYYPEMESRLIDTNTMGDLDKNTDYWMFMGGELESGMRQRLKEQGYRAVSIVKDGNLGRIPVYVYRLDRVYN